MCKLKYSKMWKAFFVCMLGEKSISIAKLRKEIQEQGIRAFNLNKIVYDNGIEQFLST